MYRMRLSEISYIIMPVLVALFLTSCAHISAPPHAYYSNETVDFLNIEFRINSVERASSFANFVGQSTYANEKFTIIEITQINRRKEALPFHLKPIFSLIDGDGNVYEPSNMNNIMINMGRAGGFNPAENVNPNVRYSQKIVFDVPDGKYKLRVLVPIRAQVGFGGLNEMSGPYFFYELFAKEEISNARDYAFVDIQKALNNVKAGSKAKDILKKRAVYLEAELLLKQELIGKGPYVDQFYEESKKELLDLRVKLESFLAKEMVKTLNKMREQSENKYKSVFLRDGEQGLINLDTKEKIEKISESYDDLTNLLIVEFDKNEQLLDMLKYESPYIKKRASE